MSYLSNKEYIETVSSWEYYTNTKQFNCKANLKTLKEEYRREAFKNRNGCENRLAKTPRQTYENIKFYDCFCNHLSDSFDSFLYIHEQYSKGFLPFGGSVLEQPNKAMEVVALISKLKHERELKLQKDSK